MSQSQTPVAPRSSRTPCFIIAGVLGCLVLCVILVAIAAAAYFTLSPSQSRISPGGSPGAAPLPFLSATQAPAPAGSTPAAKATTAPSGDWSTFAAKTVPFTIQYPKDWTVEDSEDTDGVVLFISPDQSSHGSVIFLDASPVSVDAAMQQVNSDVFGQEGDVQVIAQTKNPDGSITEEIEFDDSNLGGRVHSYARLVKTMDYFYLASFNALADDFAPFRDIGKRFVGSLQVK